MTHPCISPTTVTGALTWTTLDSRIRTSFVFSHISRSSASCKSCLRRSCWMQASRSKGAIFLSKFTVQQIRVDRTIICACLVTASKSLTRIDQSFSISSSAFSVNFRLLFPGRCHFYYSSFLSSVLKHRSQPNYSSKPNMASHRGFFAFSWLKLAFFLCYQGPRIVLGAHWDNHAPTGHFTLLPFT